MKRILLVFVTLALSVCTFARAADAPPKNLLGEAKPQFCLANEETPVWQDEMPKDGGPLRARWVFSLPESISWTSATLQSSRSVETCVVNGTQVIPPVKGMRYTTLPGISPKLFKPGGSNSLEIEFSISKRNKEKPAPPAAALIALKSADLDFQTRPILGDAGSDYFTVGCRTKMPATVTLEVGGKHWESPEGVIHSFRATDLQPGSVQTYSLTAHCPIVARK